MQLVPNNYTFDYIIDFALVSYVNNHRSSL